MSKYREQSTPYDISFEDLEIVEKLLKTEKLTDKQKQAIKNLLKYYFESGVDLLLTDDDTIIKALEEPKTGQWILADEQNKEDVENDNYRFICSECQCSDIHVLDDKWEKKA